MASDSSTSTTPMILTPESTGGSGSPDSSASSAAAKKARRQTAFYPNVNSANKPQKPFSRSAAKRESVMALGSIEHLQHYFTKTGIAAKKNPLDKPRYGLVPAIGGKSHIRTNPSLGNVPEFQLPPSPVVPAPTRPAFPPFIKTYETDPESLLPGVVDDLTAVARIWEIDPDASRSPNNPNLLGGTNYGEGGSIPTFDVLSVLKTTTRAIRSIRNYLLSLPDESTGTIRAQFRSRSLAPTKSKPSTSASSSSSQPDPLTLIRRSALEVLTVLRDLEEGCRVPLTDEAYDAQSDGGSRGGGGPSRFASPNNILEDLPPEEGLEGVHEIDPDTSVAFSLIQVQGRDESVPVWEDEEASFMLEEEEEKKEHWDERLVLGSGWLYRQDMKLEELEKEKRVVGAYLDVVDEVLFGGKKEGNENERGWERERRKATEKEGRGYIRAKGRRVSAGDGEGGLGMFLTPDGGGGRRRVSTGMVNAMGGIRLTDEPEEMDDIKEDVEEEESVDDEELPEWARRSEFVGDDLGRAHAILLAFLPSHLLPALAPPTPRTPFLESLSSGQLLCVAYNACVRKSKKPWGYVSRDAIHDILALEKAEAEAGGDAAKGESGKKGWTFRRSDNLRLWAGALKLRYLLPIYVPSQPLAKDSGSGTPGSPLTSPSTLRFPTTGPSLTFDAKVVARKEEEWEDMLEGVLEKWMAKVVEERRAER